MIICCDIDGVLADVREYVVKYLPHDWKTYFSHTEKFEPILALFELLYATEDEENKTYLVTGRPESNRSLTVRWLESMQLTSQYLANYLWMRKDDDPRPTCEIKIEWFRELKPDLIIDDDPEVVKAATKEGFIVLQVHGFRCTEKDSVPEKLFRGEGMTKDFSFVKNSVGKQSPERTLMILTYELGKLIEYHLKNQQKEMSDLISMVRYFCEQKGWNYEALKDFGEEGYLDRMEDLSKHATPEYVDKGV